MQVTFDHFFFCQDGWKWKMRKRTAAGTIRSSGAINLFHSRTKSGKISACLTLQEADKVIQIWGNSHQKRKFDVT